MDLVTKLLNLVAPPTVLTALFLILPPLYFSKFILSILSSLFPENMAHKVVLITGASSGIDKDVNFWGSVYPAHAAIPHLKKTGGRIIVTASVAGWNPMSKMSFYNVCDSVSKVALISFYDTLRIEFGPEIGITIATPGWVESEMTKGKFLDKEGKVRVDPEQRDAQVSIMPVTYAADCAEALVNAARRGERYVTVPAWFKVWHLYRVFAPEVQDLCLRMLYVTKPEAPGREAPGKKILDVVGAKSVPYPPTIQTAEVKRE